LWITNHINGVFLIDKTQRRRINKSWGEILRRSCYDEADIRDFQNIISPICSASILLAILKQPPESFSLRTPSGKLRNAIQRKLASYGRRHPLGETLREWATPLKTNFIFLLSFKLRTKVSYPVKSSLFL
jgi:hypothetical protein